MGRLVRPRVVRRRPEADQVGTGHLQAGDAGEDALRQPEKEGDGDGYLSRVAKYVPAEVVGFFLFVNNILEQTIKNAGDKPALMAGIPVPTIAQYAFIIGLVLTPVYICIVREKGESWILNAVVSTVAFPVWAYAIGAVFFAPWHDGNFASILLATFTVISGLLRPPAVTEPAPAEPAEPAHA
jgi:hypothetical protein